MRRWSDFESLTVCLLVWAITPLVLFWLKSGELRTLSVSGAGFEELFLDSRDERKVVLVGNMTVESMTLGSRMSVMRSMSCQDLAGPRRAVSALDWAMPRHRKESSLKTLNWGSKSSLNLEKIQKISFNNILTLVGTLSITVCHCIASLFGFHLCGMLSPIEILTSTNSLFWKDPKSQPLNHMPYRRPTLIIKASYTTKKDQDQLTDKFSRAILLV